MRAETERRIAKGIVSILVRAIGQAEGKAAIARARKQPAGAFEEEALALRAELARVEGGGASAGEIESGCGGPRNQSAASEATQPGEANLAQFEDAGPAAQSAIEVRRPWQRLIERPGRAHVRELQRTLQDDDLAVALPVPPAGNGPRGALQDDGAAVHLLRQGSGTLLPFERAPSVSEVGPPL